MSTNAGIAKLSTEDATFKNFTITDGLQSNEFNGRACFKSKDGNMYFGGINGFNVFNSLVVNVIIFLCIIYCRCIYVIPIYTCSCKDY